MRVIAKETITIGNIELFEGEEYISDDEVTKQILWSRQYVKAYDDTQPLPPIGVGIYEPGMSYRKDRLIIKDSIWYQANTNTSTSWVHSTADGEPNEWNIV